MIQVPLAESPPDGLHLEGTVSEDVFHISKDPDLETPVLHYDLRAHLMDGMLLVSGRVAADFSLRCVRCLEAFPLQVEIVPYHLELPVKNEPFLDLTDRIREDILLDLPGYPRCEMSNLAHRSCPRAGQFDGSGEGTGTPPEHGSLPPDGEKNVWGVLDDLSLAEDDSA